MDEDNKPIHTRARELIEELEAVKAKHGLTDEQLYQVATDDTRKEYWVKMFELLKEYTT